MPRKKIDPDAILDDLPPQGGVIVRTAPTWLPLFDEPDPVIRHIPVRRGRGDDLAALFEGDYAMQVQRANIALWLQSPADVERLATYLRADQ